MPETRLSVIQYINLKFEVGYAVSAMLSGKESSRAGTAGHSHSQPSAQPASQPLAPAGRWTYAGPAKHRPADRYQLPVIRPVTTGFQAGVLPGLRPVHTGRQAGVLPGSRPVFWAFFSMNSTICQGVNNKCCLIKEQNMLFRFFLNQVGRRRTSHPI